MSQWRDEQPNLLKEWLSEEPEWADEVEGDLESDDGCAATANACLAFMQWQADRGLRSRQSVREADAVLMTRPGRA